VTRLFSVLTYRGGPLISAVEVCPLYWGRAWEQDSELITDSQQLNAFFTYLVQSTYMDQLAEYSVPQYPIEHGVYVQAVMIDDADPPATLDDARIRTFLQHAISTFGNVPDPTPNTLYFVYLPPGVTVNAIGGQSCTAGPTGWCGYHDSIDGRIFYAVIPYPCAAWCRGPLSAFDALTSISSHEFAEAITDPVFQRGWFDETLDEVGDPCANGGWKTKRLGPYTVQQEGSNQSRACK
jgi:hypothetical protein